MSENRRETRYTVPEIYQELITLKIKKDSGEFVAARLLNISLSGIKIEDQFPLPAGSIIECSISIPESIIKEIPFGARVAYCIQDKEKGAYLIGAQIIRASEQIWVDIFFRTQNFINASLRTPDTR